jgi:flagellar assembly protein FliH
MDKTPLEKSLESAKVEIKPFQPRVLGSGDTPADYQQVKNRFGSLASTDSGANTKFQLHAAAKRLLGVENEELSHIEDRVQAEVQSRLEKISAQAYQDGYKKGENDGRVQAESDAKAQFAPMMAQFNELVAGFDSIKQDLYHSNEQLLIRLIFDISKEVLLRDLKQDPEYVKRLAAQVIEKIGAKDSVRVRISRSDFSNVEQIREFIKSSFPELKNIQIDPSDDLELGGCKVETDLSRINASVAMQLQSLEAGLKEGS